MNTSLARFVQNCNITYVPRWNRRSRGVSHSFVGLNDLEIREDIFSARSY